VKENMFSITISKAYPQKVDFDISMEYSKNGKASAYGTIRLM
jgi:hypothetical protein